MESKDQRLEIRIPQHQLSQLDSILQSVDAAFAKTRSDMVRMFISQGINRSIGLGQNSPLELPLAHRLSLFFQLETLNVVSPPRGGRQTGLNHGQSSEPTRSEIIQQIYLNRFFWFFELDENTLRTIGLTYPGSPLLSLLNAESNPRTVESVNFVAQVIQMYDDIQACLKFADDRGEAADLVRKRASRLNIPLRFAGFPELMVQLNQMAAVIQWLDRRQSAMYLIVRPSNADDTDAYRIMLEVYCDIKRNKSELTLELLDELVSDPRFRG